MNLKKSKAQISVEYLIFIAIFLLFFQAIILPAIYFSENVLKDTHAITETYVSINQLANNLQSFANSVGYGKRTVFFYLPRGSTLLDCNNITKKITYQIQISSQEPKPNILNCNNTTNICTFEKQLYIGNTNITCERLGPGFAGALTVTKDDVTGDLNVFP